MKRLLAMLTLSALVTACGTKEDAAPDTTAATPVAATPAPITLDSMAGDYDWVMQPEAGDSILGKGMSHQNADGTGYSISEANPKDTVKFTTTIQGDSVIMQSAPYVMTTMPKEVGQVTWRLASGASGPQGAPGMVTISPVAKPDTVLMRARVTATKR